MANLEWHDFYEIGVDFIDAEHKNMLSIMRAVQEAVVSCNLDKADILTDQLLKESKAHFKHEEEFLEEAQFPGLVEHNHYHNGLLVQANRIKEICQGIDTEHDLMMCFDEMEKFLIDDIMYGDIKFKSYLEFKGYTST